MTDDDAGAAPSPKRCSTCGQWLASTDFHRSRKSPDGRQYHCKECHREAVHRHYHRGPGKAYRKAYQAQTSVKARKRDCDERHIEARLATRKAYRDSVWGRLLKARDRARYKLRRTDDPEAVARLGRLIAMHEAEITRMRAAREVGAVDAAKKGGAGR